MKAIIRTKKDLRFFIQEDAKANGYYGSKTRFFNRFPRFLINLRKLEYAINNKKKFVIVFRRLVHRYYSDKTKVQIPPNCLGYGIKIIHNIGIIINSKAKIGNYCTIHQFVTIGSNGPHNNDGCPIIGDLCYIGAGAIVIGNITIGNNCNIGAGAVVTKSFENGLTIVGVPAKALLIEKKHFK